VGGGSSISIETCWHYCQKKKNLSAIKIVIHKNLNFLIRNNVVESDEWPEMIEMQVTSNAMGTSAEDGALAFAEDSGRNGIENPDVRMLNISFGKLLTS
jgi:hypothetical protein